LHCTVRPLGLGLLVNRKILGYPRIPIHYAVPSFQFGVALPYVKTDRGIFLGHTSHPVYNFFDVADGIATCKGCLRRLKFQNHRKYGTNLIRHLRTSHNAMYIAVMNEVDTRRAAKLSIFQNHFRNFMDF